jgi:hypothetical protein
MEGTGKWVGVGVGWEELLRPEASIDRDQRGKGRGWGCLDRGEVYGEGKGLEVGCGQDGAVV